MSERVAQCLRCGAPANPAVKGGRLLPLRGITRRSSSGKHGARHRELYAHADQQFCATRMPHARRRPDRFLPLWGDYIDDRSRRTRRA